MIKGAGARLPRWLVVVALAFGVACMHSLGHVSADHAISEHAMPHHGQTPQVVPQGGDTPGLDPTAVCLAVMTPFLVLWLIAVKGSAGRRLLVVPVSLPGPDRLARPPPRKTAVRLAELSVLRV
ncbi:hypothetical protein ACWENQ_35865 [Nonomuraea sp. NPDC004354]